MGNGIVTGSDDTTARVWDAASGGMLSAPLKHRDSVWFAQFSPDGTRIVTACGDKNARVWDARTGQLLMEPFAYRALASSIQFSRDGKKIFGAPDVWDAQNGQPLNSPANAVQFSVDGQLAFTASKDGRVWNAETVQPLTEPWKQMGSLRSTCFSPDGRRLITLD